MKKSTSLLLISFAFISCKKELKPQESSITFENKSVFSNPTTENTINNSLPIQNGNTLTQKPNPAHGQPGHVCSNEGQTQNTTAQPQSTTNQQFTTSKPLKTNQTTATKTTKGINPPHGQPGHRCDITVGAPLNSKPKTTATTTASTVPPTIQTNNNTVPTILSPTNTTTAEPVKVEPGMNPPHGQSGHVCGIAVGAPLNQEKKTEEKKEETPK